MITLGKYGEALGIWELRVGGFDKNLKPRKGDNLRLCKLMAEANKRNDSSWMMNQIHEFLKDLIARDHPPLNEVEKEELECYVEFNLSKLMEELLVTFKWSTKEDMDNLRNEQVKKLKLQVQGN